MKVNKKYNCLFIGNAIIDVVSEVSFNFLEEQKIDIGSWRPVSVNEINELQEKMNNTIIASGDPLPILQLAFHYWGVAVLS